MWIFTGASLHVQRLDVGVHGDELDLVDARVDHAVDGVQAGTADADDLDHREIGAGVAHRSTVQARGLLGQRHGLRHRANLRRRGLRNRSRARRHRVRRRGRRRGVGPGRGRCGRRRRLAARRLFPARNVIDRALVRLARRSGTRLGRRRLLGLDPQPGAALPRSRGRAPRAGLHACLRDDAPLSTSLARSRYMPAASPVGSYRRTDIPFTGASA